MSIGIRDLKNRATEVVRAVEEDKSAIVVTRHGRPAVLILPLDAPEAEDYILAHAPEILSSLREADADLRAGRTVSLSEYRRRRRL